MKVVILIIVVLAISALITATEPEASYNDNKPDEIVDVTGDKLPRTYLERLQSLEVKYSYISTKSLVGTNVDPPAPVSVPQVGAEQWRVLVSKYDWDVNTVLRILQCESQGRSWIVNDNPGTRDYSVGLMQINLFGSLAATRPSEEWLKVPANNIKYAYQMSGNGANFSPWTCYYL